MPSQHARKRKPIQAAPRDEITLGELTIESKESRFSYKLAALGTIGQRDGVIAILSTVASHTAIKALHACLSKAVTTSFHADCEGFNPGWGLTPSQFGYRFHTAKLGLGSWHSLAVARVPGLVCRLNETSLWSELQKNSITTPLLPSWMPWLRGELERQEYLAPLHSFQCEGAILDLTTEALDEVVSRGLRRKRISI